jgi:predicted amidohydrolase YtcJ
LHRVSYEPTGDLLEAMIQNGIESGFGDEWIRLGATYEHTVDGSFSERTMAISRPYIGISPPYQGNLTETQEDLNAWAERVHRAGIRLNCHVNGDVAIDRVLTAYEQALKLYPRGDVRPKITHCSLINGDLVRRMKALNVVPAEFSAGATGWSLIRSTSTPSFVDGKGRQSSTQSM